MNTDAGGLYTRAEMDPRGRLRGPSSQTLYQRETPEFSQLVTGRRHSAGSPSDPLLLDRASAHNYEN